MMIEPALPTADDTGQVRRWYLPVQSTGYPRDDERDDELEYMIVYARFLGVGSSQASTHARGAPHPDGFVTRGVRCNACRWFETRVFRELLLPDEVNDIADLVGDEVALRRVQLGNYVIHSVGMSVVDGEVPLCSVAETRSPFTVVELMTTRRGGTEPFIAKPSARALSEAADNDPQLADAYVNRAVS